MSLGFDRELNVVNAGDTATLVAYLYDTSDRPVPANDITWVTFTIQKPDKTRDELLVGEVQDDGSGLLRYADTDQIGQYIAVATFTLAEEKRSTRCDFEVIDPFVAVDATQLQVVGDAVWSRIEDCFDADDEGPWLRDWTNNTFNKDKMQRFVGDALFDINLQNPPTSEAIGNFVTPDGQNITEAFPLLVQGAFLQVLRHLMRSYVEQPNPTGAQIAWQDRRDYLQRWEQIYQIEKEIYMRQVALWKRQFLGLGHSKLLVSSKAGRLLPAPLRTRNAGRGYL